MPSVLHSCIAAHGSYYLSILPGLYLISQAAAHGSTSHVKQQMVTLYQFMNSLQAHCHKRQKIETFKGLEHARSQALRLWLVGQGEFPSLGHKKGGGGRRGKVREKGGGRRKE